LIDQATKRIVDEQLAQKGLTKVEKYADRYVGYQAAVKEEKSVNFPGRVRTSGSNGTTPATCQAEAIRVDENRAIRRSSRVPVLIRVAMQHRLAVIGQPKGIQLPPCGLVLDHGCHLTTVLLVGLSTDWLRREETMKTAVEKTESARGIL